MVSLIRVSLSKYKLFFNGLIKVILKMLKTRYIWWDVKSKSTLKLQLFLKSIDQFINEALINLKYRSSEKLDKALLYTIIKRKAHHLDKILLLPNEHKDLKSNNLTYQALKESLEKWKLGQYHITEPIKWALKILEDYENNFPQNCPDCRIIENKNVNKRKIETLDLITLMRNRRSRRIFSNIPIDMREKERLIEAAIYAPCSCNRQTIRILFIENTILKNYISQTVPGGKVFFHKAPTIILILVDIRDYNFPEEKVTPFQDAAAAIQNILLIAETMELSCCWGSYTSFGEINMENELRKKLKIPNYYIFAGAIAIGYKDKEVQSIPRDNIESKFSINEFKLKN